MLRPERILVLALTFGVVAACGDGLMTSTRGTSTNQTSGPNPPPPPTGMIKGTVMGPDVEGNLVPVPGVSVAVFSVPGPGAMGAVVAQRTTDSLGQFAVQSLNTASYGVAVNPPAPFAFRGADLFVDVAAGMSTPADFVLQRQ